MTAPVQTITVIRLVRLGGPEGAAAARGVVAEIADGQLHEDADGHRTYLIVSHDRALARPGPDRHTVSDIRVGDVVGWVAESYGALWVADQIPDRAAAMERASE